MKFLLAIFISKIVLTFSECPKHMVSNECIDLTYHYKIDNKVCASKCPSKFSKKCVLSICAGCNLPTSPKLFELEFSKSQNLSETFIASSIDAADKWMNPSGVSYILSQTAPLPTIDRGFYFAQTSSITSNQHYIPSLYFTANAWIFPYNHGNILTVNLNSQNYIEWRYDFDENGWDTLIFIIIAQNSNDDNENALKITSPPVDSVWKYYSIQINQVDCSTVYLSIYSEGTPSNMLVDNLFTLQEANFPSGNYLWTIGKSGSGSFQGFLYWIEARNDLTSAFWDLGKESSCYDNKYSDDCIACDDSCQKWPWCIRSTDCSICYATDCLTCDGYSAGMCTKCKTGILPYCCDWLADSCKSTWDSSGCATGKVLIDGICLYATPDGSSDYSVPIISVDFTTDFAGVYDPLITSTSASSYNYWNSPESTDPLPAKMRGLYFIPDTYLVAPINLCHTFSVLMWVYPISGTYVWFTGNKILIHSNGAIDVTFERSNGTSISASASLSINTHQWNCISYSVQYFYNGISTITPYIDALPEHPTTIDDCVFRPHSGGSLYLGSSDFYGFISYFQLWQKTIPSFMDGMNYFNCEPGSSLDCLWNCDYDHYFDGSSCEKCLVSCKNGCVRADSCGLCENDLCLKCSSFSTNSCILCAANASGSPCECNKGYTQTPGKAECLACYKFCSDCTGLLYYQCTSCISGYYYLSKANVCLSDCPLGYTKSTNECLLKEDLVFDISLSSISGIIYDSANSIPVITGSLDKFYPNYEDDDPISAYLRGFYFDGKSSVMRLPEYKTYVTPKLNIGPIFMISIWLNIENENSSLFSKTDISNNYSTIYAIILSSSKPALQLLIKDSVVSIACQAPLNSYKWSHLAFLVKLDGNGNTVVMCYINTNPDPISTAGFGYFQDINLNAATLIGAQQISQNIGNFFQGFLYEIKIFNTDYDIKLLAATSCLENCDVCHVKGSCLPNCKIFEYWEGPEYDQCSKCNSKCKGCKDSRESCSVCYSSLCETCIDYSENGCITCKSNASLMNNTCICDTDCDNSAHNETTNSTDPTFFVTLLVFKNNSLSLNFSDPLQNSLKANIIKIAIEDNPDFAWELEQINTTYYSIPMNIKDKIKQDAIVNATFFDLSQVRSIGNETLNSSTVSSKLNKYDPSPDNLVVAAIASKATAVVQSAVIGSIALSFLNPNPSSLWGLMNCLQILSYLSLSGIPFSDKMSQFLSNLNSYNLFPNFFEHAIDEKDGNKAYAQALKYGYNTDQILLNQGDDFSIIIASMISLPFIIYLADCSYRLVGKRFKNLFKNLKYSFYIRFWLQCYLELGAAAAVGLVKLKSDNAIQIVNIVICFGVFSLLIASPIAFFYFTYKNRYKIQRNQRNFALLYDSFFYEFQTEKGFIYSLYYFVFFIRRLLYTVNLVFLCEYPKTQVFINIICSLMSIFYLIFYRPFKDRILQISNLISEIMIGVIMCATSFYLFEVSSSIISGIENAIIFISMIIMGAQFFSSVSIFLRTIYQIIRHKIHRYRNDKFSIHPLQESKVVLS
ncbi:unnamed protein product [Blepharisma stoltei]|uniref:TNFR-Cys domain-containing protein n=1 Tax=Blepharisma stoltei TaxID=1481888 RepID=A0AAU9KB32_9CILI|nr:unnamed protein product [Blepharisma stoltei]